MGKTTWDIPCGISTVSYKWIPESGREELRYGEGEKAGTKSRAGLGLLNIVVAESCISEVGC